MMAEGLNPLVINWRTGEPMPVITTALSTPIQLPGYETGVWTPTLTFATPGDLAITYDARNAIYTKIGNLIIAHFGVSTLSFTHSTASGDCRIEGLPFVSSFVNSQFGTLLWGGVTKVGFTQILTRVPPNSSTLIFQASGSGVTSTNLFAADMPSGGTVVLFGTAIYRA